MKAERSEIRHTRGTVGWAAYSVSTSWNLSWLTAFVCI